MSEPSRTAIWIEGDAISGERGDCEEAWVLRWPAQGIEIPWPKGMTVAEAIRQWALEPRLYVHPDGETRVMELYVAVQPPSSSSGTVTSVWAGPSNLEKKSHE